MRKNELELLCKPPASVSDAVLVTTVVAPGGVKPLVELLMMSRPLGRREGAERLHEMSRSFLVVSRVAGIVEQMVTLERDHVHVRERLTGRTSELDVFVAVIIAGRIDVDLVEASTEILGEDADLRSRSQAGVDTVVGNHGEHASRAVDCAVDVVVLDRASTCS